MVKKHRTLRAHREHPLLFALALGALLASWAGGARSDATADKKRAIVSAVHRLAIVAPFFSVERLHKSDPEVKLEQTDRRQPDAAAHHTKETNSAQLDAYQEQLRKLTSHIANQLVDRTRARTPFEIIPPDAITRAFTALSLSPAKLFGDNGQIRSGRFPQPDGEGIRKLAGYLHADAILTTVLDEPQRTNGHYSFNPLSGIDYSSSHVSAHGGFFVMLHDGTEVLHANLSVVHPLTHIGSRSYLLVDWQEAHDLLVEDMLDELTRYLPEKR